MLRDLVLVTSPVAELVTLAQVKAHLRLDGLHEHDARVGDALVEAVGHLDGYAGILGRALAEQEWTLFLDAFPADAIRLPLPPLIAVDSVSYVDPDGVSQTLDPAVYTVLDGERAELAPAWDQTWPATRTIRRAVAISFTCGWEDPGDAPWPAKLQPVLAALKLMVEQTFTGFDPARATAIDRLLRPLRLPRL